MESIGELIEKLVIANIKLWMVKDAQTAFSYGPKSDMRALAKHLTDLTRTDILGTSSEYGIASLKKVLAELEKRKGYVKKESMTALKELIRKDIELCEARASLRRSISQRLGDATPSDTVKKYGKRKVK